MDLPLSKNDINTEYIHPEFRLFEVEHYSDGPHLRELGEFVFQSNNTLIVLI